MSARTSDALNHLEMRALMSISHRARAEAAEGTKHAGDMRLQFRSALDDARARARELFPNHVATGADVTPEGIIDLCARAALGLI